MQRCTPTLRLPPAPRLGVTGSREWRNAAGASGRARSIRPRAHLIRALVRTAAYGLSDSTDLASVTLAGVPAAIEHLAYQILRVGQLVYTKRISGVSRRSVFELLNMIHATQACDQASVRRRPSNIALTSRKCAARRIYWRWCPSAEVWRYPLVSGRTRDGSRQGQGAPPPSSEVEPPQARGAQ